MRLERLHIESFRNFDQVQLELAPHINVISGANGSGKTSFLEAIYCLGFGRSFRTHQVRQIVQDDKDALTLFARLTEAAETQHVYKVGYRRHRSGEAQIKIDGNTEKGFAALARLVPVQLVTPESVELITGGPRLRRQFVDWGLFHVEQSFYPVWTNYVRLLKQRNSLLRQGLHHRQDGSYWDQQLAVAGEQVAKARAVYINSLNQQLDHYCQRFLPDYQFRFKLSSGWHQDETLLDALKSKVELDRKQGFTSVGPHKAEWQIRADGVDARERLSRGQLKLLTAGLRLVQSQDYKERRGQPCIILVDDLPAELDERNQAILCDALQESGSQVFITTIDEQKIKSHFKDAQIQLFHVEHGTM